MAAPWLLPRCPTAAQAGYVGGDGTRERRSGHGRRQGKLGQTRRGADDPTARTRPPPRLSRRRRAAPAACQGRCHARVTVRVDDGSAMRSAGAGTLRARSRHGCGTPRPDAGRAMCAADPWGREKHAKSTRPGRFGNVLGTPHPDDGGVVGDVSGGRLGIVGAWLFGHVAQLVALGRWLAQELGGFNLERLSELIDHEQAQRQAALATVDAGWIDAGAEGEVVLTQGALGPPVAERRCRRRGSCRGHEPAGQGICLAWRAARDDRDGHCERSIASCYH